MKYIIKNCDCYNLGACCTPNANRLYCKDITNCLLKQIVGKCQYKLIVYEGEFYKIMQENNKAKEILELLEIEECE